MNYSGFWKKFAAFVADSILPTVAFNVLRGLVFPGSLAFTVRKQGLYDMIAGTLVVIN